MKKCPYCAEEIQDEAIVCRFCGKSLIEESKIVAPTPIASNSSNSARNLVLLGAAVLILGAMLPWGTVSAGIFSRSIAGYEGDGLISGAVGVIILIAAILSKGSPGKRYSTFGGILGILLILLVIKKFADLTAIEVSEGIGMSIGSGLWLTLVGTVMLSIGGLKKVPGLAA